MNFRNLLFTIPLLLPLAASGGAYGAGPLDRQDGAGVAVAAPAHPVETIRYQRGACRGSCPVYHLTVTPDADGQFQGRFTGIKYTGVLGDEDFTVSPGQAAAFRAALAPYRPKTGTHRRYARGNPGCEIAATDQSNVTIEWRSGATGNHSAPHTTLFYDFGCDPRANAAMSRALRDAPSLLPPVAAMIERLPVPLLTHPPKVLPTQPPKG